MRLFGRHWTSGDKAMTMVCNRVMPPDNGFWTTLFIITTNTVGSIIIIEYHHPSMILNKNGAGYHLVWKMWKTKSKRYCMRQSGPDFLWQRGRIAYCEHCLHWWARVAPRNWVLGQVRGGEVNAASANVGLCTEQFTTQNGQHCAVHSYTQWSVQSEHRAKSYKCCESTACSELCTQYRMQLQSV